MRALFCLRTKITGDPRPSSYPFVSGDGFRALARLRFDSIKDVEAATRDAAFTVNTGDIIFVTSSIVADFFEGVHPIISNPYILITHNGDTNIGKDLLRFIDDKIIRWFAQNVLAEHPKLTPIPIGLENLHHYQNGIISFFRAAQKRLEKLRPTNGGSARKARIFYNFKVRTNPKERQPAFDYLDRNRSAETVEDKLSPWLYLKKLSSYMFVASPPGNGADCHRTWEALYVGTVPIVKRSVGMDYFKGLGLPMLVIDEWEDLDAFDEEKLRAAYEETMNGARAQALSIDYWADRIRKVL